MLSTIVSQLPAQTPPLSNSIKPDYRECCAVIWSVAELELGQTVRFMGLQYIYCEQQQQRKWGKHYISKKWIEN